MNAARTSVRRSGRLAGLAADVTAPASTTKTRKRSAAPPIDATTTTAKKRPPTKKAAAGPSRDMERTLWAKGFERVAGVDEAGRGPLAGPVVAAAVVLPRDFALPPHLALDDSKKMDAETREAVFSILTDNASGVCWAAHAVPATEIDRINILQATMVAMDAAVEKLATSTGAEAGKQPPSTLPCPAKHPAAFDADHNGGAGPPSSVGPADFVLVDGPRLPPTIAETGRARPVVKGDAKCSAIAAASVVAKVVRDRLMERIDAAWPVYGFAAHKGYGTAGHVAALRSHGPCPQHRRTFAPVKGMV